MSTNASEPTSGVRGECNASQQGSAEAPEGAAPHDVSVSPQPAGADAASDGAAAESVAADAQPHPDAGPGAAEGADEHEPDRMPYYVALAGLICVIVPIFTLPLAPLAVWVGVRCWRTRDRKDHLMYGIGILGGALGLALSAAQLSGWY